MGSTLPSVDRSVPSRRTHSSLRTTTQPRSSSAGSSSSAAIPYAGNPESRNRAAMWANSACS